MNGRERLRTAFSRALALPQLDLRARIRFALAGRAPRRVVAIGKAAGAMTDGALDACGASIEAALVVLPDGSPAPRDDARVRVMRAAHPLPDARSVAAGEAALAFGADLALVSGGASSLVFVPADSLDAARAAIAALLASGADVRSINVVRRHASLAHGGGLGLIDTLLASDVLDGEPHDVGSGPTVPDPTTLAMAREVLLRCAPSHASLLLRETPKEARPAAHVAFVAEPGDLATALGLVLVEGGVAPRVEGHRTGDVNECAALYTAIARGALVSGEARIWSAEPSVRVDVASPGAGGRCTHLAALVARDLPPGVVFLAAASDGVDGTSGTAGAVVDASSFPDRAALDAAIAAFDTGPLHRAAGTAIPGAPTGLNLTDVHALLKV